MVREIPLFSKKYPGLVALVDDEDYERVVTRRWHPCPTRTGTIYVVANRTSENGKHSTVGMHNFLMNPPLGMVADHIDGNELNNQRSNLRVCTQSRNVQNMMSRRGARSAYKGVYWNKKLKKWQVAITVQKSRTHLGLFDDETVAAKAYDEAARILHGEYGRYNFPREGEQSALAA